MGTVPEMKVTTVMGSYGAGVMETFRLTRKRGGALKAKETPKVEIMIQGLCEIGRN